MTDHKFTDDDVIKAMKHCSLEVNGLCKECPLRDYSSCTEIICEYSLALINRQKAVENNLRKRIDDLEHTLAGVMWSVDKWLDGADLKQDEVNRAIRMREKTLEIVERLEEENEFLKSLDENKIRAEAINAFAKKIKTDAERICDDNYIEGALIKYVDTLVKEMTEVDNG